MNLKITDMIKKCLKYSLVGFVGFLISTVVYFITFEWGAGYWAWFIANAVGGIFAFLIFYFKVDIFHADENKALEQ